MRMGIVNNRFPEKFLWGASTSGHQVEGDNIHSDWWEWEQAGCTEPSGKACDHYHRFRDDFRIAKELGHNAHRLGIEWSRLEKAEGVWDQKEWDHYKEVLDALGGLNIEPMVTLNHFTLPIWLAREGGWKNDKIVRFFSRFAEKAVVELGDKVRYWITINEPLVLAYIAYLQGKWPPQKSNFEEMLCVARNMLKSHVSAYHSMKEACTRSSSFRKPEIGLAWAVAAFHPCSMYSVPDRVSAFLRANFQNHSFIRSAIKGHARFFPYIDEPLPCKNTIDFIGLNYYFREFIHHKTPMLKNPFGWVCSHMHHEDAGKRTMMGWEIYPRGLYEVVKTFSRYKLPIIITENGLSIEDDNVRREYIKEHLKYLLKAIGEGSPVIGYLHWSLLDNFEWSDGYSKRFGLVHVDFRTQKRTIRDSARYYASIINSGIVQD